jgi:hypothetical protein
MMQLVMEAGMPSRVGKIRQCFQCGIRARSSLEANFTGGFRGAQESVKITPVTAHAGTVLGENPIRANYTAQPIFGPGTRTANGWFNPAAFATPPAYTFGNVGRNSVYGPPLRTLDLAVVRSFTLTERTAFEFRGEAFNALNMFNLGTPNRFVNTPQFGTITMPITPVREFQLSARLAF